MEKLERKDYKAIKHMNREIMEKYLNGIYQRGYSDGATDMAREQKAIRRWHNRAKRPSLLVRLGRERAGPCRLGRGAGWVLSHPARLVRKTSVGH